MARAAGASGRLVLLILTAYACGSDATSPDPEQPPLLSTTTCPGNSTLHGGIVAGGRWAAEDNPHAVVDTLAVTSVLTIEPGVEVCIEPDVLIRVTRTGAIRAQGAVTDSIVFTAGNLARRWGGIRPQVGDSDCFFPSPRDEQCTAPLSTFEFVRLEHATQGIHLGRSVQIRNSHFRQIGCTAVAASYLAYSRVDSAGIDGCPSVTMGYNAGGNEHFEENVIVGSGGAGLAFEGVGMATSSVLAGSVALLGGRIEESRGPGLQVSSWFGSMSVVAARPLRIAGGATVSVLAPMDLVAGVWPTIADQDSLRGNAGDTLRLWGDATSLQAGSDLTFVIQQRQGAAPAPWSEVGAGGLTLAPGATLVLETILRVYGPLNADGNSDAPVLISANSSEELQLRCLDSVSTCDYGSRITSANIRTAFLGGPQTLALTGVTATDGATIGAGDGSVISDLVIDGATTTGLFVRSNTSVSDCAVRNSQLSGITVDAPGGNVTIRNCFLESNGGAGVRNDGDAPVDARYNWWGDPTGPLGPNGDGVEGNVDYSSHLTEPPLLPGSW